MSFQYIMDNWLLAPKYLGWLWDGFLVTLWISACTIVTATLLGFLLAAGRASQIRILQWSVIGYSTLFRNTPLLIQLFFWYFAGGQLFSSFFIQNMNLLDKFIISGISFSWPSFEFLTGFLGLTLYSAAFITEEIRAGINGVAGGQKSAANALGLTDWQSMRYVILPQARKIAMLPLFGQYMNVIKNSSLAMAIGVAELSYASRQVETETLLTFQTFGVSTVLYVVIVVLMEIWGLWCQRLSVIRER
jgi:polar amino acid transport system permease protein